MGLLTLILTWLALCLVYPDLVKNTLIELNDWPITIKSCLELADGRFFTKMAIPHNFLSPMRCTPKDFFSEDLYRHSTGEFHVNTVESFYALSMWELATKIAKTIRPVSGV